MYPNYNGVDLSDYILEMTFEGGDGRRAQLYFKNSRWANVYSHRKRLKATSPYDLTLSIILATFCDFQDFAPTSTRLGQKSWVVPKV